MTQMVIVMEFMIIGPVANSNTAAAMATTLKAMFVFGLISVQLYLKWVGKLDELTSLDNINILLEFYYVSSVFYIYLIFF